MKSIKTILLIMVITLAWQGSVIKMKYKGMKPQIKGGITTTA